jgi:hypothetical protein
MRPVASSGVLPVTCLLFETGCSDIISPFLSYVYPLAAICVLYVTVQKLRAKTGIDDSVIRAISERWQKISEKNSAVT